MTDLGYGTRATTIGVSCSSGGKASSPNQDIWLAVLEYQAEEYVKLFIALSFALFSFGQLMSKRAIVLETGERPSYPGLLQRPEGT